MNENQSSNYDRIVREYRQACEEYEEATAALVALAAKPDCEVEDFRCLSERVDSLSKRLTSLREAMRLTYRRTTGRPDSPAA